LWETEGAPERPTATQLEKLADAVKRPVATFFLPTPPAEQPLPVDFRRPFPATAVQPLSHSARLAIRRARRLQGIFAELGSHVTPTIPGIDFSRRQPAEVAARLARESLRVSLEEQAKWREPENALKVWRSRVEDLGLLVFQLGMPKEEVSGFSLSGEAQAIVLNKKDHHARRCFTLFHEWAHLLLGEPGLCFVDEGRTERADESVEVFCNAFAVDQPASLERAVEEGARRFAVSRYVILRRFLTANIITAERYRSLTARWDREHEERRQKPAVKKRGGPAPHVKTVSELGGGFVSRVLSAHDRGIVSDLEVADYFALKLRHLEKVEALVTRVHS
jgi:Zn-dependent peptidase ImmA (M78 family)